LELPTRLLSIARVDGDDAWQTLTQAGACPSGAAAFHALRIAAGFPLYGLDISEEQLAQEVGRTSRAISFTKGCYLGQEPIARIDAMGHVNRELRRLEFSTGPLPTPGTVVHDKPAPDGKPIGQVTSAAWSLRSRNDDKPLALAYLRNGFNSPGTKVVVADADAVVQ
jgi:folate-binding protein YgfZ